MVESNRSGEKLTTEDFAAGTTDFTNQAAGQDRISAAREDFGNKFGERRPVVSINSRDEATGFPPRDLENLPLRDGEVALSSTGYFSSAAENEPPDTAPASPLLSEVEIGDLRSRWSTIQAEFVDEPRRSVEQADQLVASAMQRLAEGFANERASLEKQWDRGDMVSTEELRLALQRYRAFFGRLLNAA